MTFRRIACAVGMVLLGFVGMAGFRVVESLYADWAFLHQARVITEQQALKAAATQKPVTP